MYTDLEYLEDLEHLTEMSGAGAEEVMAIIFSTFAIVYIFGLLISIPFVILNIVATWKMQVKAGRPGWAAIVPIYNLIVYFQVGGLSPWLVLLYLVPGAALILNIIVNLEISKKFGQGIGFGLGLIFLPVIFRAILAFGNYSYVTEEKIKSDAGIILNGKETEKPLG